MAILVVDDREDNRELLKAALEVAGYSPVLLAGSAREAYDRLGLDGATGPRSDVDLILMDIRMPDVDGVEACRRIKSCVQLRDIPVLMITAEDSEETLKAAYAAGAGDFLARPVGTVELVARVRSALTLKSQLDRGRAREHELVALTRKLEQANAELARLARLDGLTGVANRRAFDEALDLEWRRMARDGEWLSLVMIDIDHFKAYNDTYSHVAGDQCLVCVASLLSGALQRAGDFVARYGGEEFCIVLAQTDAEGARILAERVREGVAALGIPHAGAPAGASLTISIGTASIIPDADAAAVSLVMAADAALYRAKGEGRNRVRQAVPGGWNCLAADAATGCSPPVGGKGKVQP